MNWFKRAYSVAAFGAATTAASVLTTNFTLNRSAALAAFWGGLIGTVIAVLRSLWHVKDFKQMAVRGIGYSIAGASICGASYGLLKGHPIPRMLYLPFYRMQEALPKKISTSAIEAGGVYVQTPPPVRLSLG